MKHNRKPVVYVSGPLSLGDPILNTRRAVKEAEVIIEMGGVPIVPHVSISWQMISPHDWDYWISYDLDLLNVCDAIYRIPGESKGADLETARMSTLGKPVFADPTNDMTALVMWIQEWNEEVAHESNRSTSGC